MPRFTISLPALAMLLCGFAFAQDATVVTDNAAGISYSATLPNLETSDIRGSVVGQSNPSGTGVLFQVSLSGFPAEGGPFLYHIHDNPIANGNCSTAGGHLDPFLRGDSPACDSENPSTCQVGDLSGKHGKINGTTFSANYVDDFVSTTINTPAFMGNRSVVIHYANKTMITCASFSLIQNATNTSAASTSMAQSSSTGTSLTSSASTTATGASASQSGDSTSTSTGAAASLVIHGGTVLLGLFAFLL